MEKALNADQARILDLCRDIELLNEELYWYFADLFQDDEAMKALWSKTALEEQNHANQFLLASKVKRGLIDTVSLDLWSATSIFKYLKTLLRAVKATPPSLAEALRLAIKLEGRLESLHVECVATFVDPTSKEMFQRLTAADKRHVQALKDVYELLTPKQIGLVQADPD